MAEKKYLDETGLSYAWGKIKEWLGGGSINVSGSLNIDSSDNKMQFRPSNNTNLSIYNHNSLNISTGSFTWACANSKESAINTIKIDIDRDFAFFAVPAGMQINHIKHYFGMSLVYFDASEYFHYCQFNNELDVSIRIYAIKMTGTSTPTFQFLQTVAANGNYKLESQNNELYLVFWCSVKS